MSLWAWLGVAAAGGAGALARFLVDAVVSSRLAREYPVGTLTVNLTGAVALGLLVGLAVGGDALEIAGVGALGSYTTFSTWMLESQRLGEDGELGAAALNIGLSLLLGLAAAWAGRELGAVL